MSWSVRISFIDIMRLHVTCSNEPEVFPYKFCIVITWVALKRKLCSWKESRSNCKLNYILFHCLVLLIKHEVINILIRSANCNGTGHCNLVGLQSVFWQYLEDQTIYWKKIDETVEGSIFQMKRSHIFIKVVPLGLIAKIPRVHSFGT